MDGVLTTSARAEMTFPRVDRDLLILAPSLRRVPFAPVESARSDPARSTNEILLTWYTNVKGQRLSFNELDLLSVVKLTFSLVRFVAASWQRWVKKIVNTA